MHKRTELRKKEKIGKESRGNSHGTLSVCTFCDDGAVEMR